MGLAIRISLFFAIMLGGFVAEALAAQTYAKALLVAAEWPVFVASPSDDASRLFVGENLSGNIRILDPGTQNYQETPFLRIDDLPVVLDFEQGLLGMTFDPNFSTNGHFYVSYTGANSDIVFKRFTALGDPSTSTAADPSSGLTILRVPKLSAPHNGGWLGFGPDGYMYVSTGDGGDSFDEGPGHTPGIGNAQDITDNLLGKILRLDVHGDAFPDDPNRNYAIPASNPFVGIEGDDEIWAYGFRNPWRASFDQLTGDLWVGDVGQNDREEINFIPAGSPGGLNFGWRLREGSIETPFPGIGGPSPPGAIGPMYEYSHIGPDSDFTGGAVIGGAVYRGPVAAFGGHYLFGDFYGNLWDLDPDAVDISASVINIKDRLIPGYGDLNFISSFGQDADGNLYITNLFGAFGGEVFRVATHAQDAVWNGNSAASGTPGNGVTWSSANNWTRGGFNDVAFAAEDNVIFDAGSSIQHINLDADQTVAAITFTAPYTVENHKLRVLSGNITVASGVTATISSDLEADNANRSLRKLGGGTLIVDGHAGQTVVKEGTLGGTGTFDHLTVKNGGTLIPGGAAGAGRVGELSVDDSFRIESGGRLTMEIGGLDNSDPFQPQFDSLKIHGVAKLSGVLSVGFVDLGQGLFEPVAGDQFTLISAYQILGAFDALDLPPLWTGLAWVPILSATEFTLLVELRTPGDYNGDGLVDAADYVTWRKSVGSQGPKLAADGSGPQGVPDGIVDAYDYYYWRSCFTGIPAGQEIGATVPAPASISLVAILAAPFPLILRRR